MRASYMMLFGNLCDGMSDQDFYDAELELAELAEPLGYSAIGAVEHHFDGPYAMCPDNIQLLSYLAAKTETITLMPAAVILPWHDPLRVVEKLAMLDTLSHGRMKVAFGRGLAKQEYDGFRIDMNEARERFDEAAELVMRALETGVAEGNGKFYKQPRVDIVPAPRGGLDGRLMSIAMSENSVLQAAELGAQMATFIQFPIEGHLPLIETYRGRFEEVHKRPAPPICLTELTYCHEDPTHAQDFAREHVERYFMHFMRHYEMDGGHFKDLNGYQTYETMAAAVRDAGLDASARGYADAQTWGTPEQMLERIAHNRSVIGDYDLNLTISHAGMPHDKAEASMRLIAEKVLPALAELEPMTPATVG